MWCRECEKMQTVVKKMIAEAMAAQHAFGTASGAAGIGHAERVVLVDLHFWMRRRRTLDEIVERHRAVNLRLAGAEQVEIGTVEHEHDGR